MRIFRRLLASVFAFVFCLSLHAGDDFTKAETQQISIKTPGLFDKGHAFTLNLDQIKNSEYAFPLPVGKAVAAQNNKLHISTTAGDAIKAMFAGKVRLSRNIGGYGNVVVIRHDNGLETVYSKNAQNLVKVGDKVKAGQTIAIVGGERGKIFCRFFIMVNGSRINPSIILDVNNQRLFKQALLCEKKGSRVLVSVKYPKDVAQQGDDKNTDVDKEEKSKSRANRNDDNSLDLTSLQVGEWAYPLPGGNVISPYGGKRRHSGVDLKTRANDKIVAAFAGTVTRSGPYHGYGNCIVIRHDNGLETLYSHQSKNLVKVGQKVKAGEVIGLTGRTGRATTDHLHFEVRYKGVRLNPSVVLDYANRSLQQQTLTYKNGKVKAEKNYFAKGKK